MDFRGEGTFLPCCDKFSLLEFLSTEIWEGRASHKRESIVMSERRMVLTFCLLKEVGRQSLNVIKPTAIYYLMTY
jgi:hypothetical protein